ncbi:MAG: sulfatase, partial [Armatimonadota bacterium]
MRILYIDIDSLRLDHLGCYGYHRNTSPNIDRVAAHGVRCTNVYASDVPCLPSRTALFTGRLGIHTGVVNHGGGQADLHIPADRRAFNNSRGAYITWMTALRRAGYHTASISSFPTRHAGWHFLDGFCEWRDMTGNGLERADQVTPTALEWLKSRGQSDNWFLHVNLWDPYSPYRTPPDYGNPFEHDPAPDWLTQEIIDAQRESYGPHSARELYEWTPYDTDKYPRVPAEIRTLADFKRWIDGYDTGIRYADDRVGQILNQLSDLGGLDETLIIISADHGENQGELNVYGDHQTADQFTCNIPLIIYGPDIEMGQVDSGLHYHLDLAPTITEFVGGASGEMWDGQSFLPSLTGGPNSSRDSLVISQAAWSCQRAARWDNWLLIRTYHDGLKDFPESMLFDLEADPHETTNIALLRPDVVSDGLTILQQWYDAAMREDPSIEDPM